MCGFRNKKHGKKIKGTLHPTDKSDKDSFQDSPSLVFNEQPECNVSPILEEKISEILYERESFLGCPRHSPIRNSHFSTLISDFHFPLT